jgi:predicted MFS family arabinose efflux permease
MVLGRILDDSYSPEVRQNVTLLTVARLTGNSAYRYLIPFLSVVARGMHVRLSEIGVALTVGELAGLSGSGLSRIVDRLPHRTVLVGGLLIVTGAIGVIATAQHLAVFAIGLLVMAIAKIAFDIALVAWIADRVPATRRGRVIGITESSWAISLFIGVAAMGAITAIWSWRWAYAACGVTVFLLSGLMLVRLPKDPPHPAVTRPASDHPSGRGRINRRGLQFIIGVGLMMLAGQLLFVMLGPWLQDHHGFGAGGLAAVAFGLGVAELGSSTTAVRMTDRWGGRSSVRRGSALIVPAAALFAVGRNSWPIGLAAFVVMVLGFEFAIISAASVATSLVVGSPAAGFGVMITAGTMGRASGSLIGTVLYERRGPVPVALLATGVAAVMVAAFHVAGQPGGVQPASPGSMGLT